MATKKSKPLRDRIARAITGSDGPSVDSEVVRQLAALLDETGLSEIEIERAGVRVRVAKGTAPAAATIPSSATTAPLTASGAHPQALPSAPVARKGTIVTSPMVGTVYLSPQPGAAPFVNIGDAITDGIVCIIEAMKTMNPVPSPAAGHVAEIFVRDGQAVEFGEPLMRIE